MNFKLKLIGVLATAILSTSNAQTLVASYPFDGNVNDVSGNGLNGSINGSVTTTTGKDGIAATAYSFPGINNNYVSVSNNSALNFNSSYTINLWMKYSGTTNIYDWEHLISKGHDTQNSYVMALQPSSSSIWFAHNNGGGTTYTVTTPGIASLTGWHFVSAVVDVPNVSIKIYIDGSLSAVKTFAGMSISTTNTYNLGIGLHAGDPFYQYPFNGKIDNVSLYSGALSACQIKELYSPSSASLVASYPFDGNTNDVSGNGLNGSINGSVTTTTGKDGIAATAYSFPGINNNYVSVSNNSALNFNSSYTINLWMKYSGTTNIYDWEHLISKGRDTDNSYVMVLQPSTSSIWFTHNNGGGTAYTVTTSGISSVTGWHFVSAVVDVPNVSIKIYIDGSLIAVKTFAGMSISTTNTYNLGIGLHAGDGFYQYPFNGKIDNVSLYSSALSDCKIKALYNNTSLRKSVSEATIIEEQNTEVAGVFYPNPTQGILNIVSPYEKYTLKIFSSMGSEVFSKEVSQTNTSADLTSFSAGVYIVKIESLKGSITKKIQVVK